MVVFSLRKDYMYALCVSGAVNTQDFVWTCVFLCAIYKFSFIHSFIGLRMKYRYYPHINLSLIFYFLCLKPCL